MTGRDGIRAAGYIDGLNGARDNRMLYPPFERFNYDAGRRDGERSTHPALHRPGMYAGTQGERSMALWEAEAVIAYEAVGND